MASANDPWFPMIISINLLLVPVFPWSIFPLIGWGFGITMHYIFGVSRYDESLRVEEAKIERMATKTAKGKSI